MHVIYRIGDMRRRLILAQRNISISRHPRFDIRIVICFVNRYNRYPELYLPTVVLLSTRED